ncbi:MAG: TonB-dependent receptor [Rhodospirillales bacterium]|nr:TonB-dependent receptor [Rhodospirillales bacterium]
MSLYRSCPVQGHVGYGIVDATFRSTETLASVVEPSGIQVRTGDRLPGIPRHNLKAGIDWRVIPRWRVGVGTVFASSQHLRGDEGNNLARIGGYAILNGSTTIRLSESVELWGRVDNILDRDYETGGTRNFNAFAAPEIEEQRFLAPGHPRGAWAGVRVRLENR